MSQKPFQIGRRHFLTGVGGFALAIPFLPSLEKDASAGTAAARPNFFYLGSDHGGCWDANFFPTSATPNDLEVVPGHSVSSGPLAATTSGGTASLSAVLNASSSALTSALVAKMNVLRGLDVPWYIAHNTGLHLGNFAQNDGNGGDNVVVAAIGMRPTIDQLMANSSRFYTAADAAGTKLKSMIMNSGRQLSWAFSVPNQGVQSPVQSVQGVNSSLQLFNSIFGSDQMAGPAPRPPVVDKILANYKSLREGNARLSAGDKARLDTHIAMLAELQSSLNARVACMRPATPTDDAQEYGIYTPTANATKYGQLWADVVAAAFACGASRIGVLGFGDTSGFCSYRGTDWHHDVAHQWYLDQQQAWLVQSYQGLFEQVFVYLAAKLNALDAGNGQTVLDNSLLVWSQESGMETHASYGVPVVTFGGAAGAMNTGLYCDYRQNGQASAVINPYQNAGMGSPALSGYVTYPGLLYDQWLATALQLVGVPKSEFELWKDDSGNVERGVGIPFLGSGKPYEPHYGSLTSAYYQNASNALPFLAKA